jgi:hypothetical protein
VPVFGTAEKVGDVVSIKVDGQRKSPQTDAGIYGESWVIVFEAFQSQRWLGGEGAGRKSG